MKKRFKKLKMSVGGNLQQSGISKIAGLGLDVAFPGFGSVMGAMVDLNLGMVGKLEDSFNSKPINNTTPNTGLSYGTGGTTPNIPVEIEGDEVIQTPDGTVKQVKGASHEQGGIDINLPEGTDVYSSRLKHPQTGESMADRKLRREKSMKKATSYKDKHKGDYFANKTYKRVKQANEIQEQEDMAIQEYFKTMMEAEQQRIQQDKEQSQMVEEFAYGVNDLDVPNIKKPKTSTPETLTKEQLEANLTSPGVDFSIPYHKNIKDIYEKKYPDYDYTTGKLKVNTPTTPTSTSNPNYGEDEDKKDSLLPNPEYVEQYNNLVEDNSQTTTDPANTDATKDNSNSYKFTTGDKLGFAGTAIKGVAPLMTTVANRMNTVKPKNEANDFGSEALTEIRKMEGDASIEYQQAIQDITNSANAMNTSLQNNARSINTLRALRGMSEVNKSNTIEKITGAYIQHKNQINQMKARTLLMKDQMRIQGENRKFDIEEQQKDNFATNINKDLVNLGSAITAKGQNLNQGELNSTYLKIISDMYGQGEVSIDQNGNTIWNKNSTTPNTNSTTPKTQSYKTKTKPRVLYTYTDENNVKAQTFEETPLSEEEQIIQEEKDKKRSRKQKRLDKEFEDNFNDEELTDEDLVEMKRLKIEQEKKIDTEVIPKKKEETKKEKRLRYESIKAKRKAEAQAEIENEFGNRKSWRKKHNK